MFLFQTSLKVELKITSTIALNFSYLKMITNFKNSDCKFVVEIGDCYFSYKVDSLGLSDTDYLIINNQTQYHGFEGKIHP